MLEDDEALRDRVADMMQFDVVMLDPGVEGCLLLIGNGDCALVVVVDDNQGGLINAEAGEEFPDVDCSHFRDCVLLGLGG